MNAADRSGPNLDIAGNAVVDASPVFPFHYTPTEGFTALNPAITYGPVAATDAVLRNIPNNEVVLAVCEARHIFVTNKRIAHFASGWATAMTSDQDFDVEVQFNNILNYTFTFTAEDKDTLTVDIADAAGIALATATLVVTDLFSGNPVFHLGYLTDAQIANVGEHPAHVPFAPGYDIHLLSMAVSA